MVKNKPQMCVVFLLIFLLNLQFTVNSYKNIRLQDYLCSDKFFIALQKPFRGDPAFTLTEHRDSAAIITQRWNATFPTTYGANKLKYDCHFRVQTPNRPRRGIYTVISKLKFRRDPLTGDCLDYIQFLNGNRSPSERICNEISAEGPGRLIFDQRDRDVSVHIHIDKRRIITEPLELLMVLTAHSECRPSTDTDFQCKPDDPYSCISKQFVRDNLTNCLFPCRDEVSCFHDAVTAQEVDTTNVALSAITSLIFTMLGVGFCVWVCWKYWNCITVQQRAHEASAAGQHSYQTRDTPVIDLPTAIPFDEINTINQAYSPTLPPPLQQQQVILPSVSPPAPATPKDLPPSYESLFPDR